MKKVHWKQYPDGQAMLDAKDIISKWPIWKRNINLFGRKSTDDLRVEIENFIKRIEEEYPYTCEIDPDCSDDMKRAIEYLKQLLETKQ